MIRYKKKRKAFSIIEILLVLAIISLSFFPLVHLIVMSLPVDYQDDDEYIATLLAHHVMETIIAKKAKNSDYIPSASDDYKPIVLNSEDAKNISEYFDYFEEFKGPVTKTSDPQLYWAINKFKCKISTYLIDTNLFKVIVYINYQKSGKENRVFLERLLSQNNFVNNDDADDSEADD